MKTYICQICGDAHLGSEKPRNCPFCGAREAFIKEGHEALPIVVQSFEIGEQSRANLQETLKLEMHANAVYLCMASKAKTYEVKAMFKRLAKVELEHATIVTKFLKIEMPAIDPEMCSDDEAENFKETIKLEENASGLYSRFAKEASEQNIRIFFTAINQAEIDHIELIKKYL